MTSYDLGQEKWELTGTAPYVPLLGNSIETGGALQGITPWMEASVPGGAALALYRNGWIEKPYYEMNSLKCEWVENKWWLYRTTFRKPDLHGSVYKLVFQGIDYDAMIYLNDQLLGEHEGMYEPAVFDITEQFNACETFNLKVLIKHAPDEMGQIGYTSQTFTQKSRFNYKWDFGTRLVNLGLWQSVEIVAEEDYALDDLYVHSDVSDCGCGKILVEGATRENVRQEEALRVKASCSFNGQTVCEGEASVVHNAFQIELTVHDPQLWYPNGVGEQPLYDVAIELLGDRKTYDARSLKQGIRKLRYAQNEDAPADALPYTFVVNDQKVYITGVNMTPLDHIYGDIPVEQYEHTLRAAKNMNVNMIRVWGGGIIEKEAFYDLCDRFGIMVWQEFIQSSSGVDNVPSKRPEFLRLLEKTAVCAVKAKRNHTSLTVWSGGNELFDRNNVPATYEDQNVAMLKGIANRLDPARLFLPTSASGPSGNIDGPLGQCHDVHGHWKYIGNPQQYELYGHVDNLFHSEFGCDGMSSLRNVKKIVSAPHLRPAPMVEDDVWRFHGDWWCTYDREKTMFGEQQDLGRYIDCSQWMQSEGLRYTLEANARRRFHNSGSIIWQFNEPWPNVSCTCLLEYFGEPKMAYYWVKRAYSCYHVSLDYTRLDYAPGSRFVGQAYLTSDFNVTDATAAVNCQVLDARGNVLHTQQAEVAVRPNGVAPCFEVAFDLPQDLHGLFFLRLQSQGQSFSDSNTYIFSTAAAPIYAPALGLDSRVEAKLVENQGNVLVYDVTNTGSEAAIHVRAEEQGDRYNILLDDNFVTLFPGETKRFRVTCAPKFRFGFDEYAQVETGAPAIAFRSL